MSDLFDVSMLDIKNYLKNEHATIKNSIDIKNNIDKMHTMIELSNDEIKNIIKEVRYFFYTNSQLCLYYYPLLGKVYPIAPINLVDIKSLLKKSNDLLKYNNLLTTDEERLLKLNININMVVPYA